LCGGSAGGLALNFRVADVGVEAEGDGGVGLGGDLFEHEATAFGADRGDGGLRAAEDYGDAVVALGDGDGEEEGLVAGAGFAVDVGRGDEVKAGGGVGEAGGGREGGEHAVRGTAGVLHQVGIELGLRMGVGGEGCG
jgi:hypothetical protein